MAANPPNALWRISRKNTPLKPSHTEVDVVVDVDVVDADVATVDVDVAVTVKTKVIFSQFSSIF